MEEIQHNEEPVKNKYVIYLLVALLIIMLLVSSLGMNLNTVKLS